MSTNNGTPTWVRGLLDKYTSGVAHAFILHFNVGDYVVPGVTLRSYLGKILASRQIVVFYNRAEGITFALPSMKEKFMQTLGLSQQQDPALAALASLQGSQEQELPKSPSQVLPMLERLLQMDDPNDKLAAVIVEYAETITPATDVAAMSADDRTNLVTLQRWGRDPKIQASGNPIFLVTANLTDLHSSIRAASSKFEAIEVPLPDRDARLAFIQFYASQRPDVTIADELTPESLANATAGLSLVHIEDIFLRAAQEGELTRDLVRERKDEIIASEFGEVLEIMEPRFGFELIGGLQHVKDFFTRSVITPIQAGNTSRVPMGVLMTGPAGTGKTAVAEAVAKESGINFCLLNPARLFGQYVGNTERNLDKALRAIESLAPCGVFIDEIDQAMNRGSGEDGVGNRFFKRLMEFMSDTGHRGKVIFLAATNRPDLMDAALRRPGRFDKKVPFLAPDDSEREAIFEVMARKYGVSVKSIPAACVTTTNGWTGAEIEAAVVKAVEVMEDQDLSASKALTCAVNAISPSTADIEYMTLLAVKECNDRDLLPPSYREMLGDRKALEQKLSETRPAETRGRREL